MTEENSGNQKITNALLKKDIETIATLLSVLPDIKNKLHDIDKKTAVVCNEVMRNKEEIDSLRKRGNINDGLLAAFTAISVTISSILNIRQS